MKNNNRRFIPLFTLLFIVACSDGVKEDGRLFSYIDKKDSRVDFVNLVEPTDSINILNYIYAYNGAGVGVGDFNNDGLEDVFFAANQKSSRLYFNKGNFQFQDVTSSAGVSTNAWCTGVSVVDINADGYLDIYVSVAGAPNPTQRANLLFINNGDETFHEAAEEYGIADKSYTTHAAFFDYDRDGDLDLYLLNHANDRASLNTPLPKKIKGQGASTDKLFRNDGKRFTEVSAEAGITIEGYGLGVAVSDINNDGWPDLYISNDFISNDLLYINNQDGTFTNTIAQAVQEQTYNAMGNDVSDFNNDGRPDIVVLDMLPPDAVGAKTMAGSMTYDKFMTILDAGYEPQFMRNTLQMNLGNMQFAEMGRLAGIHRTDWSWAPLLADFDNDGWKDLYVTNGYLKDITDKDFVDYNSNLSMFKAPDVVNKETLKRIEGLKGREKSNFIFKNQGDLTFADHTSDWGLKRKSFSNGAAYADLNNDGSLDLIVNNMNQDAFIIKNNVDTSNYISISLTGPKGNPLAIGTKLSLSAAGSRQFIEKTIYRGFMSSTSQRLHFGLKSDTIINKIEITWPDGTYQELTQVEANQLLQIEYNPDAGREVFETDNAKALFADFTKELNIDYKHSSSDPINFKVQPLLPYRLANKGPEVAAGDLDNNGHEDLVVGGSLDAATLVFFQQADGTFIKTVLHESEGDEVTSVAIFDANGDGIKDLYLACGGVAYKSGDKHYTDKLYFGTGFSELVLSEDFLPAINTSTSSVAAIDYDQDGDTDLFVGGYADPLNYPSIPQSYFLENTGKRFIDVTNEISDSLSNPGMVRDAVWSDYNKDGSPDLILAGEWMAVRIFENTQGKLNEVTEKLGLKNLSGWWQSLSAGDFDSDGDIDLICGNTGMNSGYTASEQKPITLYAPDLDQDGTYDPLMTFFVGEEETIHASRSVLFKRQPFLNKKFTSHSSFAKASIKDILPETEKAVPSLTVQTLQSLMLVNNGEGKFTVKPLPNSAQLFPINDIIQTDHNQDGFEDLIFGGGFAHASYDGGSLGPAQLLLMDNHGKFDFSTKLLPFSLPGDVSSMTQFSYKDKHLIVLGVKGGNLKIIQLNDTSAVRQ